MIEKVRKWISNLMIKFAEWQQLHWVLSIILVRLLAVWFSFILAFAGEPLLIRVVSEGKKQLTLLGIVCSFFLILFAAFSEISLKYLNMKDQKSHDNGAMVILRNLRDSTLSLCESKYNTLLQEISRIKNNRNQSVPEIISNPEKQLDGLANQMTNCLCQLLQDGKGDKWRQSDIFVSIAYEFPTDSPGIWHWATRERGLSLGELFATDKDCVSTMRFRLQSKGNKTFYNSKQEAFLDKKYIPDSDDEYDANGNLLGSIACYEDTIKKNDIAYVHYILTISTYDKHFVSINPGNFESQEEADRAYIDAVETVKYNMYKNIVLDFMMRARVEFCLLYLSQLKRSNGSFYSESLKNNGKIQAF